MYRLYIDETGNSDLAASKDANHRYLSLTGIILNHEYSGRTAYPQLEAIKAEFFNSHPDDPVILHRKDLVNKRGPFRTLANPEVEARFNQAFLNYLNGLDFCCMTVVIDKLEHLNKYTQWRYDPYHYCLEILLERYAMWLQKRGDKGDVMGEVRGGKPDRRLEDCYKRIYARGNDYVPPAVMQARLSSSTLKLKTKEQNIAGLQIVDAIAHPSSIFVRSLQTSTPLPQNFGTSIVEILKRSKYHRHPSHGGLRGYGIKWLP